MRALLLVFFLISVSSSSAWAIAYSCSDSTGRTHFSDNLQGLPDDCRDEAKRVGSEDTGNLNYVPSPQVENSEIEFKHTVRSAEQEQQQRRNLASQLRNRAENLLERYRQAIAERQQARIKYDYSKRIRIIEARRKIDQVEVEKKQLLTDLTAARVSTADKEAVREMLAEIVVE